jgi:hypothetical protein
LLAISRFLDVVGCSIALLSRRVDGFLNELIWMARVLPLGRDNVPLV